MSDQRLRSSKNVIAIDYSAALSQGGGIGRYTRELVKALAHQDQQTDYRLFAAGQRRDTLPPSPGENFSWSPARLTTEWFARLWHRARIPLPVETWTGPVRLFHATDFTLPPTRSETRTLLTVHDLSFVRTPETATPGLRAYLNSVVPRSVRRADHILADSEATRQDLIELYATPPEKVSVLYSGVDAHFGPVSDPAALQAVRARYNIGEHPYIFSLGTVQPRKNYGRLVEAFHSLNDPDLRLVIAGGKGWLDGPLYQQVAQMGLEDRVLFIGFAADEDLPALYSAAAVFAFPSLYEGFGLPPLEAMACGVPVVASQVSSLPEVVGDAGIMIDPLDTGALADALRSVLYDATLRATLISRGQAQAARFTWAESAKQLRRHYAHLLGRIS